jgi:hypothetical protein
VMVDVRFGSLADITARSRHFRFTHDSGHSSVRLGCPKSARSRQQSSRCLAPLVYAVIAANEAAVATTIALARDGFETRLMAESLSTRPKASL